jgi:hypothetical protein
MKVKREILGEDKRVESLPGQVEAYALVPPEGLEVETE